MAGSLLIGRIPVRYHDLAFLTALLRESGPLTYQQLITQCTPQWQYYLSTSGAMLKECIGFGVTLGLLQVNSSRSWENRIVQVSPAEGPFALEVLNYLTRQKDPLQRAFRGVHDQLAEKGMLYTSIPEVAERMEAGPYGKSFKWNATKINFWAQFMHDVGLIVRFPPERLALSPSSSLIRDLLSISPQEGELRALLTTWQDQYFTVFTRLGEVHEGFARALIRLENAGELTLAYASDTPGTVLLSGRRVSHYRRTG